MRVLIPQITWHNREPVLCIDFDPTCSPNGQNGTNFYRLATGGGSDTHLLIWHLRDPSSLKPDLSCVAELTRHSKAVNTLRFSPCGKYLASADDDAYVYIWKSNAEKHKPGEEFWIVDKALRKHIDDVCDLCWSPDSSRLVTTSVDNSAILWDVKKGVTLHVWTEHAGFVQGVSFDPLGEFVATISTDRTLRLFDPSTGKLSHKALKYPSEWLPPKDKDKEQVLMAVTTPKAVGSETLPKKVNPGPCNRIFHDDTLKSFCRRLSWSPRGEFLIVPGGIQPPASKNSGSDADAVKSVKRVKNRNKEKELGDKNAVVFFCRNSFTSPCSLIPTGTSYSIAARFCPIYFQKSRDVIPYDKNLINPTKKSERLLTCVGKLEEPKAGKKSLLNMPYRLVFAVATNESVIIGDTDSQVPLAVIRNIHPTRLTDLSWSPDGRVLSVSSTDGYCSIITFEPQELGIRIAEEDITPFTAESFPIAPTSLPAKTPKQTSSASAKKSSKEKEGDKESPKTKVLKPKVTTPSSSSRKKESKKTISPATERNSIMKYLKIVPKEELKSPRGVVVAGMKSELKDSDEYGTKSMEEIEYPDMSKLELQVKDPPKEEKKIDDLEGEASPAEKNDVRKIEKKNISVTTKRGPFLERWLNTSEEMTPELQSEAMDKKTEEADPNGDDESSKPVPVASTPFSPVTVHTNFNPSPNSCPPISHGQLHVLLNAPIIADMEEDEAKVDESEVHAAPTPPLRQKRPPSSPLSSQKRKQPRRVEFITLPNLPESSSHF